MLGLNELTVLIYVLNVVPSVVGGLIIVLSLSCIVSVVLGIAFAAEASSCKNDAPGKTVCKRRSTLFFRLLFFILPFILLLSLVPNKEVMYMMAASEMGETVVDSPRGQELIDKINTVLDAQLNKLME